ncbi:MAG TPA: class II fructose-bisphosphate aldolase [Burkholderiales bacterium]|nr:class II fructose-bisphosphate aldolase [Burkholderiales bacterium]
MALISLRQLLDHAADNDYGVPAFNINDMEQIQAIMQAAAATDSPVILQASAGARKYAGEPFLRHMAQAAVEMYPQIPIVLHQDHGASPAVCQASIRSGFSSVMMDGSLMPDMKTPASYAYNIAVTAKVAEMAHAVGVSVEGELGCLGSLETGESAEEDGSGAAGKLTPDMLLTDPEQAADFVRKTGVDALAIAIGTSHGAYKFSRRPSGEILAIDRVKEIHRRVPATHLVMHGSSSVPQEWLEVIREFGGEIRETYGVPLDQIQEGIRNGVRKVNIDTDIRLAMSGAMRRSMAQHRSEFDPRKFLKDATEAAREICRERYEAFGCAGQASRIKPIPLEEMERRYATGELSPSVRAKIAA